MTLPLVALGIASVVGYTIYRRRSDPTWSPFEFAGFGGTTPTGGFGSTGLLQQPTIATTTPGGSTIPATTYTPTSNLGVNPATPTPFTPVNAHGPAIFRPGFIMPAVTETDQGKSIGDYDPAMNPQGDWKSFGQALGIAAAVVNPGIMGMMTVGSMIATNKSLSSNILNSIGSFFSTEESGFNANVDPTAFDGSFEAGEIAAMEGSSANVGGSDLSIDGITGGYDGGGYDGGGYDGGGDGGDGGDGGGGGGGPD